MLNYLIEQLSIWLEIESAVLLEIKHDGKLGFITGIGQFKSLDELNSIIDLKELKADMDAVGFVQNEREFHKYQGAFVFPVPKFGLAIGIGESLPITAAKIYMIRFFIEHAAIAIRNKQFELNAVEQQRFSAVGAAASYILHDVNHAIATSRMLLDRLREEDFSTFSKETLIQKSIEELEISSMMIADVRDFSMKKVKLKIRPVNLREFMESQRISWTVFCQKSRTELYLSECSNDVVYIDSDRLSRVMRNLLVNAVESMAAAKHKRIDIKMKSVDGSFIFEIADNGPGIPKHIKKEDLFRPFLSNKDGNSGLGLAICYELIQYMSGTIDLESTSEGTRFFFSIPSAETSGNKVIQ